MIIFAPMFPYMRVLMVVAAGRIEFRRMVEALSCFINLGITYLIV